MLGVPSGPSEFTWKSRIIDYSFKNDYTYFFNPNNNIEFGFISTYHNFKPAVVTPGAGNTTFNTLEFFDRHAWENGVYIANKQRFGSRLSAEYGLRFSTFSNIGVDTVYTFDDNHELTGFESFEKGSIYSTFTGLEPRLGVKYSLDDNSSVKASYNRMNQYLLLATNTTGGAPLDIWMPSSKNLKPGVADQVAVGYFRNFKNNAFETSVEGYYKWMQNQ